MGSPPEATGKAKSESPTGAVTEALGQLEIRQDVAIQLADGVVRPGYGREGKPVRCFVNLFAVQLKALQITHYDVDIQPMIRDGDEEPRRAPVTDKPIPNDINLQVFNVLKQQITGMTPAQRDVLAYDGRKFAYSPMRLNFREHTQLIELAAEESTEGGNRRQRLFNVTVKEVAQFSLDDVLRFCNANRRDVQAMGAALYESVTRALQSIEICLREDRLVRYKIHGAAGRKMFDPQAAEPISEGAQIWHGFFQSARAVMAGPVINLDPAYSCFLGGGPFLVVGAEVLGLGAGGGGGGRGGRGGRGGFDRGGRGGRGAYQDRGPPAGGARPRLTALNPREEMALRRKLLNVQVRPTHRNGGRPEAFKGFTSQSARQETFQTRDGRTVTVEAYFAETYNIRLQLPHLKCAMIGRRKNFVPLELLDIIGGTPLGPTRMSPNMTADMIRVSARRPHERLERTQQWRQQLAYGQGDRLGKWGLSVDAKPLPVNARVLNAPQVEYKKGGMRPKNGSWNLQGSQFIASGIPLVNLVVINFTRDGPGRVKGFVESLLRGMSNLGVDVRQCVPHYDDLSPDIFELKEAMITVGKAAFAACKARLGSNAAPPQLYLCILPDGNDVYKRIKSICATQMPSATPSQCVIGSFKKAFGDRGIDMYCANVAMKVNIKLGGCNHRVAPQSLPKVGNDCMMIGVDVGHAPPGSSHPSVVAVVANSDGNFRNFWTEVKAQANPRLGNTAVRSQETIVQGREMYKGVLGAWRKQNGGALPNNVIFFRDGVSEGEYSKVVNGEIAQFLAACNEVKVGYHPKVTFIVCTKRHNIRFFAADERDTDGRTGNLPSGTVVDTVCVHPYAHDFYLQSQAGLVGTARPGHYIVLRDEIRFTADEMQKLVFAVCHGFARSTKAVSMPPMTLYAHHAADKARMMLYPEGEFSDTANQSRGDVGGHGIDYAQLMQQLDRESNHPKLTRFSATLWYM